MERVISFVGLFAMIGMAWLLSSHHRKFDLRVVVGGLLLQFTVAALVLNTDIGLASFEQLGDFFTWLLKFVDVGSGLVFGLPPRATDTVVPEYALLLRSIAFGILPTIVFVSCLMSVLYYMGVMQIVVKALAWVMQRTLGTSGAETLSAAANIFVGQTEAPLVIRPYAATMTMSELMTVMVGGFATIAGGVMAAYIGMGISAGHLLTASVISAPAALLIAKVMQPEVEQPRSSGHATEVVQMPAANVFEAAAEGASAGLHLALNVGAMLIAFTAMIALLNAIVAWAGGLCGFEGEAAWSLQKAFGYAFYPIAWLMGIEAKDCLKGGELLGIRWFLTEFVGYETLARWKQPGSGVELSHRSITILTYAMCGFANFASIGIQIGGIGAIAPTRRSDLAKLGLRAMLGGSLASFMTACVAGVLYTPEWEQREKPSAAATAPTDQPEPIDEPTNPSSVSGNPPQPAAISRRRHGLAAPTVAWAVDGGILADYFLSRTRPSLLSHHDESFARQE